MRLHKSCLTLSKTVPGSECDPQVTGAWLIIKLCCLVTTEANIRGPTSFGNIPFTFPIVHTSVITTPKEGRMLFWKYYSAVSQNVTGSYCTENKKKCGCQQLCGISHKTNHAKTTVVPLQAWEQMRLCTSIENHVKNNNEKYISLEWLYFGQTVQSRNLFRPS